MKMNKFYIASLLLSASIMSCSNSEKKTEQTVQKKDSVVTTPTEIMADRFADIQVLRYDIPGFANLSAKQKELAYYLYEAGLCGRDIAWDQKYKYNLCIRKTIETILTTYAGDKNTEDYKKFIEYSQRVFFANGIHHHYSNAKMLPDFNFEYFKELISKSDNAKLPLEGMKVEEFTKMLEPIISDPKVAPKAVDLSANVDIVKASAGNFYEGVTQKQAETYYAGLIKKDVKEQPMWGLNSKLMMENGKMVEKVWKSGGMYGAAIDKIVYWLEKASTVAENEVQKTTLMALIKFYKSGDLKDFDDYSVSWVTDTASRVDVVNGFIEVYHDAMQKKGGYESVVSMKDMEATKRIAAIAKEAQWFEDHSPIADVHKKKTVKGISAKVITVIGEAGDNAPSTPIGINLPNSEWIRESHGSKSVSLSNIVYSYNFARAKSPTIVEFGASQEVKDRVSKYGPLSGDLETDMHEVIGHASGQINKGIATPDVTLKNYAGTLEEARADLVGLYYIMDQKLIDIGVSPSIEVGKAQYDYYIMNGLMTQLFRIKPGDNLEEAHMRNRQMNAAWVFEKGKKDNVIERVSKDGKTYFKINDYNKLRDLFGQLLKEIQRMKSEGDFNAGKNLVENYGVKVDQALLKEVHERMEKLNVAPYMGFIQPKLVPLMEGDKIVDVKIENNETLIEQMLRYGKDYGYLPVKN